jgi:hypothetical protein
MPAAEEHICISCGSIRDRLFAEPLTEGYELVGLICAKCKTVLKFVDKRPHESRRLVEIGLKKK